MLHEALFLCSGMWTPVDWVSSEAYWLCVRSIAKINVVMLVVIRFYWLFICFGLKWWFILYIAADSVSLESMVFPDWHVGILPTGEAKLGKHTRTGQHGQFYPYKPVSCVPSITELWIFQFELWTWILNFKVLVVWNIMWALSGLVDKVVWQSHHQPLTMTALTFSLSLGLLYTKTVQSFVWFLTCLLRLSFCMFRCVQFLISGFYLKLFAVTGRIVRTFIPSTE